MSGQSSAHPSALRAPWRAWASRLGPALLGLVLALNATLLPGQAGDSGLDSSWQAALVELYRSGARAGVDYVFTFGPLGCLYGFDYAPETYWLRVVWGLGLGLAFAAAVLGWSRALATRRQRVAFVALALLLPGLRLDALPLFLIYSATLALYERPSLGRLALWGPLLAGLAAVKFTWFLAGSLAWGAFAAGRLFAARAEPGTSDADLARPSALRSDRRALLGLHPARLGLHPARLGLQLAWAPLCYFLLWAALGQSLSDWPAYVAGSLEITAGYAEGMAFQGGAWESSALGVAALGIALAALARLVALGTRELPPALLGLALAFLAFKHGVVRQDSHVVGSLSFVTLAAFLSARRAGGLPPRPRRALSLALSLSVGAGLIGLTHSARYAEGRTPADWLRESRERIADTAAGLWAPRRRVANLERERGRLRARDALPRIRAAVGDERIDVLTASLNRALLNDLRWAPRPVIQGYSAYTPSLAQRNAEHLLGPAAPRWLLLDGVAIDEHPTTLDDGPALLAAWRAYDLRLLEGGFSLLRRRAQPLPAPRLLEARSLQVGERYVLPEGRAPRALELDLRPSLLGAARRALFRPALIQLELELEGGALVRHRLTLGASRAGFLLDPYVAGAQQLGALFAGLPGLHRVRALRVLVRPSRARYYAQECQVRLFELAPRAKDPALTREFWAGLGLGLPFAPLTAPGLETVALADGTPALQVHAPGRIEVEVPPGARVLTGRFGIRAQAGQGSRSDGVGFSVSHAGELLWARRLDPRAEPRDRGPQSLRLELPPGARRLTLSTDPGASGDWDWSYWAGLEFGP